MNRKLRNVNLKIFPTQVKISRKNRMQKCICTFCIICRIYTWIELVPFWINEKKSVSASSSLPSICDIVIFGVITNARRCLQYSAINNMILWIYAKHTEYFSMFIYLFSNTNIIDLWQKNVWENISYLETEIFDRLMSLLSGMVF